MERHVPRGGGNSLKPSHNQDFSLIEAFNNLALWGEKKFVSELKRTYKFQRGVNNRLDCHANQTRILSKEYSFVAGDYVRSTARNDVKRHTEDNSPKYRMVGKMKRNSFTDKVYSLFTTHHSLKRAGATHVALCESVGSYFRHWCGAFTLAEVLITLGIIGVVSAMTVPTLMQNYQRQSYVTQLHKTYNEMSQALLRYQTDRNAINLTEAGLTDINSLDSFMKNYFKIVKDCGMDETACFGSNYKMIDGSSINFMSTDSDGVRAYVLANGASIAIISGSNYFHLDVNGKKGPNIVGRDTFAIKIHSNGLLDEPCNSAPCSAEERDQLFTNHCMKGSSWWWGCFGKILNDNWQMNY